MTIPPQLDTSVPHSARVWNYLVGGKDNFAADREVGDMIITMFPDIVLTARSQRRFLVRAVRHLTADAGIRQFIDIGTGLPTGENTHHVAQRIAPESRIVYIDNDPLVVVHAEALLGSAPGGVTSYLEADVRDPDAILRQSARTLDFSQPTALIMVGILGQLPDSDEAGLIVTRLLEALPSGSYLVLNDGTDTDPAGNQALAVYNENTPSPYYLRPPAHIAGFFDGLELVSPGLVPTTRWRPEVRDAGTAPREVPALCGVGRKPLIPAPLSRAAGRGRLAARQAAGRDHRGQRRAAR